MALSCAAERCSSNESTKIEGRDIALFPFPEDDKRRNLWIINCQLSDTCNKEGPLYLCELHFDQSYFTSPQELKPDAIPRNFNEAEDHDRKRKADETFQSESSEAPPIKHKKSGEDPNTIITPPQSPLVQLPNLDNNVADNTNSNKTDTCQTTTKDSDVKSDSRQELKPRKPKKVYKLIIQIDKIFGKPCPRSNNLFASAESKEQKEGCPKSTEFVQVNQSNVKIEKKAACIKGGCKLRKSIYDSKPAYQCEYCEKFYVTKQHSQQEEKNICTLCNKGFSTPQMLYLHIKNHFICDICQTECTSQASYDKHVRLHVSTDPLYPYKCHQCVDTFQMKEYIRQHYTVVHPTVKLQNTVFQVTSPIKSPTIQTKEYRCTSCNITFRNQQAYRNHVSSHKQKEGLRHNIGETNNVLPVANPLTGSQIGILRAVKFSCRVCSMEFDNVREVDKHTRTHLGDTEEEQKCNICRKVFRSSAQFAEHLKYHLSRAHPCPMCPKAFINRASLKNHFKTHGKVLTL